MFESKQSTTSAVADRLASLVACASDVVADARGASNWPAPDRVAALATLDATVAAVAEARAHLLVADRDAGDSQLPGDRSYEAARARVTRAGVGDARRQVQQADALVSMGTVAVGVRDGSVPLGHLDVLARVAAAASPEVAAVLRSEEVQQDMVRLVRVQSAPDFGRALARFVAAQDPAGLEAAHQDSYQARFLVLSAQPHGVFLKGQLDSTAAESLRVALDAMAQFPDETRTPGQACADALVMLAERICAGTSAPLGAGTAAPLGAGTAPGASRVARAPGAGHVARAPGEAAHDAGDVAARMGGGLSVPAGSGDLPDGGSEQASGTGSRPHLSLLVPAATFAELLAHEQARHPKAATRGSGSNCADSDQDAQTDPHPDSGSGSGSDSDSDSDSDSGSGPGADAGHGRDRGRVAPDWSPVPPATLEDGTPVAMSELARCLCDADITRIVMAADGQPLDVGRTRRLHTPAQRKAVIARDQQCVWNGCETPAPRCEVHHIRWWNRDNGPTDVEHAALVCRHHHGEIHRHDLSIHRLPNSPGIEPGGAPLRYVFRSPDRSVANAPPAWTGETVAPPGRTGFGSVAPSGRAEVGTDTATRAASVREARRVAREQASFALFESDRPPPEWATG